MAWQGRKLSFANPTIAAFLPMLFMVPFLWLVLRSMNRSSHDFNEYRSQLRILSSEVSASVDNGKRMVTTIGRIRNDSPYTWSQIALEIQYFNSAGKLIDTVSESSYSLTVPAHSESAFRVRAEADKPGVEYASQQVFIREASEPHHW
jgi:hypothetical protein